MQSRIEISEQTNHASIVSTSSRHNDPELENPIENDEPLLVMKYKRVDY